MKKNPCPKQQTKQSSDGLQSIMRRPLLTEALHDGNLSGVFILRKWI